jgi:hypothetical protein
MSEIAKSTKDHEEIRRWVDKRGGRPAMVEGTAGEGSFGVLRIDFPGYSGGETLKPITWQEFFWAFDGSNLAFLYQEDPNDHQENPGDDEETELSRRVTRDLAKEKSSIN